MTDEASTETSSAETKNDVPPVKPAAPVKTPAPAAAPTEAEKTATATAIYTIWRNSRLRGLPTAAYNRIETEAPHLIAAIIAAL